MEYLLPLLAAYGICFGLMNEKLEYVNRMLYKIPLRRDPYQETNLFSRMTECAYCTGFHSGWIVWLVWRVGSDMSLTEGLLFPFASSAFCYALDIFLRRLE